MVAIPGEKSKSPSILIDAPGAQVGAEFSTSSVLISHSRLLPAAANPPPAVRLNLFAMIATSPEMVTLSDPLMTIPLVQPLASTTPGPAPKLFTALRRVVTLHDPLIVLCAKPVQSEWT